MEKLVKLKDVETILNSIDRIEEICPDGNIINVFLQYTNNLNNLSIIVDFFRYKYKESKNLKKDLKLICNRYDITEYKLMEASHILINNLVLGDNIENNLYLVFIYNLFLYTKEIVYGDKFKYNREDNTEFYGDGKMSFKYKNDSSLDPYILNMIVSWSPNYALDTNGDIARYTRGSKLKICTSLDTRIKNYIDSYLCKYYLEVLLGKEISSFYTERMNSVYDILQANISIGFSDENIKFVPRELIDLLKNREFLLPYNGISITTNLDVELFIHLNEFKISNNNCGIFLDVYERQLNGENYIIIIDTTREYYQAMIINLHNGLSYSTSNNFYEIVNKLIYLYKLDDKVDMSKFPLYTCINISNGDLNTTNTVCGTNDALSDYEVEVPYYWRYRGAVSKKTNIKRERIQFEKSIYVGAFKRKLPKGSTPSKESKALAKLYCINLEEDETIVRPHTRHYLSNADSMSLF